MLIFYCKLQKFDLKNNKNFKFIPTIIRIFIFSFNDENMNLINYLHRLKNIANFIYMLEYSPRVDTGFLKPPGFDN